MEKVNADVWNVGCCNGVGCRGLQVRVWGMAVWKVCQCYILKGRGRDKQKASR